MLVAEVVGIFDIFRDTAAIFVAEVFGSKMHIEGTGGDVILGSGEGFMGTSEWKPDRVVFPGEFGDFDGPTLHFIELAPVCRHFIEREIGGFRD